MKRKENKGQFVLEVTGEDAVQKLRKDTARKQNRKSRRIVRQILKDIVKDGQEIDQIYLEN